MLIKVTEKDGLPKLICSSCVYKVISWVTFKTQCEQSDEILRTTFQCSGIKATTSPSNEQSTFPQDSLDCESNEILYQSNNEPLKAEEVETLLGQSSEPFCDIAGSINNWNTSDTIDETDQNERLIDRSKQGDADEDEVTLRQFLRNI